MKGIGVHGDGELRVLGPLEVRRDGAEVALGPPRQRAVLAILAAAGQPVSLRTLSDLLWRDRPPRSATEILYRYANGLRDALEPGRASRDAGHWIRHTAGSYQLVTERVDAVRFRRLAAQGRRDGDLGTLLEALRHWHGPVAADIEPAIRTAPLFRELEQARDEVIDDVVDLAVRDRREREVLPVLRTLAAVTPGDEHVHAGLIRFLARLGRSGDARQAYADIERWLAQEHGTAPGPELRAAVPPMRSTSIRPAQLPARVAVFSGRDTHLAGLAELTAEVAVTSRVVVITGMPGVGKTTLAVHWAHHVGDEFPDGLLYVNLRGFDPEPAPLTAAEVLHRFLTVLGLAPADVPADADGRSALFRSVVVGRRLLLVLDNARDSDQVMPLLPATAGCLTLVTSRSALTGLVAAVDARPVVLEPLDDGESAGFLADRLGPQTVAGDRSATRRLIAACGGLPLALSIVAARVATSMSYALSDVADQLQDAHSALQALDTLPDADVRAAFSWSYRTLHPPAARLFRLLAVHPGPEVGASAAASATGGRVDEAGRLLRQLADAQLVREHRPGRFVCHDLLRAYAAELLAENDDDGVRHGVLDRLTSHYLHTSAEMAAVLRPELPRAPVSPAPAGVVTEPLPDRDTALAWYDAERPVFVPLLRLAHAEGLHRQVCELAWALMAAQDLRGHWPDWLLAQELSCASADSLLGICCQVRVGLTVCDRAGEDSCGEGRLVRTP